MQTLNKLQLNTYAEVIDINSSKPDKIRLADLGILKGTKLRPILKSPLGDPTAYEVRKSVIVLREEDAVNIKVKPSFP